MLKDMCAASDVPIPSFQAAGLRKTRPREAILAVLGAADRPLSAEEIWRRMPGRRSGLPTVYRNLERFVAEGWAEGFQGKDQVMRYVRCLSRGHHHHVQCEACGRVSEIEGCGLEAALELLQQRSGFQLTRHELQLFGLCPACREGSPVDK